MKDHISQPVAIGLCTARKLSGRRSQLPVSSQWPKLSHKHASIQATAATPSGQHANPPVKSNTCGNQGHTHLNMKDHISQPVAIGLCTARKLSGRRSQLPVSSQWPKLSHRHPSIQATAATPSGQHANPPSQIKYMWQPRTYSSQHERPHQPARRNWSLHCPKAQWKEKSIACLIPVANTVTPTPKHSTGVCHMFRPSRPASTQTLPSNQTRVATKDILIST